MGKVAIALGAGVEVEVGGRQGNEGLKNRHAPEFGCMSVPVLVAISNISNSEGRINKSSARPLFA